MGYTLITTVKSTVSINELPPYVRNGDWRVQLGKEISMDSDTWRYCADVLCNLMDRFVQYGQPRDTLGAALACELQRPGDGDEDVMAKKTLQVFGDRDPQTWLVHY